MTKKDLGLLLLNPFFHFFLLVLLSSIGSSKFRFRLKIFTFIYFVAITLTPLPKTFIGWLENAYPPIVDPAEKPAAVVLSGGTVSYNSKFNRFDWSGSSDRLMEAVRLYLQKKISFIVMTGDDKSDESSGIVGETSSMRQLAMEMGVPREAILWENKSKTTRENALNTVEVLKEKGFTDFYLITSATHMPRAVNAFRKAGLTPTPYPVDFENKSLGQKGFFYWGIHQFRLYMIALHELAGLFVYEVKGWI